MIPPDVIVTSVPEFPTGVFKIFDGILKRCN